MMMRPEHARQMRHGVTVAHPVLKMVNFHGCSSLHALQFHSVTIMRMW